MLTTLITCIGLLLIGVIVSILSFLNDYDSQIGTLSPIVRPTTISLCTTLSLTSYCEYVGLNPWALHATLVVVLILYVIYLSIHLDSPYNTEKRLLERIMRITNCAIVPLFVIITILIPF
ncbi:hypothetical protein FWF89_03635 [Candidatus Saccharibacteria bacterium]|nr:hypothetical protein [Candidatus Saccharibacteria bacterium]